MGGGGGGGVLQIQFRSRPKMTGSWKANKHSSQPLPSTKVARCSILFGLTVLGNVDGTKNVLTTCSKKYS